MPFINLKCSPKVENDKELEIKSELGKAIELLSGKSENYLMVNIEDSQHLYFKGKNDRPIAYFEVSLLGSAKREDYETMTKKLCSIAKEKLSIDGDNVYVKFEETDSWGYDSFMF